jgi:CRP-like cAMP-binding protein
MIPIMSCDLASRLRDVPHVMRHFGPGVFVFRQGNFVQRLHLIEEGEIHLVRHQIGGFALALQSAGPGAVLAEASLFSERYHCDAVAVQAARTLALSKSALRAELLHDAGLAEQWSAFLAREVQAARLRA